MCCFSPKGRDKLIVLIDVYKNYSMEVHNDAKCYRKSLEN